MQGGLNLFRQTPAPQLLRCIKINITLQENSQEAETNMALGSNMARQ